MLDLRGRYPVDIPPPVMEQVGRALADPGTERRGAVRLRAGPEAATVRATGGPERPAAVLDRSPDGLSLRLEFLAPPQGRDRRAVPLRWRLVEVRHSRADWGAWVVGCVFTDGLREG